MDRYDLYADISKSGSVTTSSKSSATVNATITTGGIGPQGPKGDTGATGPQGLKGDKGDAGATGADSTVPGPVGPQGLQGPKGDTGAVGPQGPKGDIGLTGPTGPKGDTGDPATNLVQSVNGRTGAVTGLAEQSALTTHIQNNNNPHNVTKSQVGLGNVDNTSDANKPISTATQTALNAKVTGTVKLSVGTTAPSSPATNDLWVDTN